MIQSPLGGCSRSAGTGRGSVRPWPTRRVPLVPRRLQCGSRTTSTPCDHLRSAACSVSATTAQSAKVSRRFLFSGARPTAGGLPYAGRANGHYPGVATREAWRNAGICTRRATELRKRSRDFKRSARRAVSVSSRGEAARQVPQQSRGDRVLGSHHNADRVQTPTRDAPLGTRPVVFLDEGRSYALQKG